MITHLEVRKTNLLSQIEMLKREIDILRWAQHKELALLRCTGSVNYLINDKLR